VAVALVIVFVVLGLGVFALAMRSGPRASRNGGVARASRGSRMVFNLALVIVVVFSIAVPTLVLAFNGEHKAGVAPGGVTLNAEQQHGRYLFAQSCAFCHTLKASAAVGRVGPDLDQLRPPESLVLSTIQQGMTGQGNMPAQLYTGRDAQSVASYVAAVAGR
jgi:mono/diheme cytochrome c family protein